MITRIRQLWQTHRLLLIAFAAALLLTLFFAVRTAAFYIYWANHRNVAIEGWMTIGYVAHSYGLHPLELQQALGYDPERPNRHPLARIANESGVPLDALIAQVEAAIAAARAAPPGERP